ncbi:alpha/beta fold hydrolase [Taylorella equigenitalis]|uniref:Hydrolase n=1 Tax=Taylorella equigenitalis ATCC 35865 TaxID=743973 RepID=A0ABN4AXU3_9BURK|nr:alpha/beta hydrolase [Taylorella equigenitalis]AFN35472.1 putative hydrolase [Taylorella equigenitalis ATCC 35865]ASY30126.1 alpha/beta hydrolase [Taylorella equigenitalis]ASY38901.1 alpha/beta hydrolase [Taylorella equigenitalis]ASY41855.1 alpha/beta hydrolase [Taylorella equigenitalis]KOS58713.1 hydrolase [Taylorella equigenitalis]
MISEVAINDIPFAFKDEGKGVPLLLIHGSLCDYRYWRAQEKSLSQNLRLIIPSLTYYWPHKSNPEHFNYTNHAEDLVHLMDHLGIDKFHVLGHSRGGGVAMQLALNFQDRIQSLILADPGIRTKKQLTEGLAGRRESLKYIVTGEVEKGAQIFVDLVSGAGTYEKMVPWFKEMVHDNVHTLLVQKNEPPFLIEDKNLEGLDNLIPICLIGGGASPEPFPSIVKELHDMWSASEYHTIEQASHGMNLSHPHMFNEIVANHVNKNKKG